MNSGFSNHFFFGGWGYSHFQTSTMVLLSYFTGCYSNTLINADTNVPPIKSIFDFETYFISKFNTFCWCGCNIFFHVGSE